MIRKFISLAVFIGTISLASFGQHIFGRQDIENLAIHIREKAPHQSRIALKKTDELLAQLVTESGSPADQCDFLYPTGFSAHL